MNNSIVAYLHYMLCQMGEMIIKLFCMIGLIFKGKKLAAIESLQRTNKTFQEFLADVNAKMKVRILIKEIQIGSEIEYNHFNEVYTDFVEKKRQSLLENINRIENQFREYQQERQAARLPNEGLPAEIQMEQAILETCYAYLNDDDAYFSKAFYLFLKKKLEEMDENEDDFIEIEDCLEYKRRNNSYDMYEARQYIPMLPSEIWIDFFRTGTEYTDILPKEWPHVAYFYRDTYIPRFIFDKSYTWEYSEHEFHDRFTREWYETHYNPDDNSGDYSEANQECFDEYGDKYLNDCEEKEMLANSSHNAYMYYLTAVSRFKDIQQRLKSDVNKDRNMEEKNGSEV